MTKYSNDHTHLISPTFFFVEPNGYINITWCVDDMRITLLANGDGIEAFTTEKDGVSQEAFRNEVAPFLAKLVGIKGKKYAD